MKRLVISILLLMFVIGTGVWTMLTARHEVNLMCEKLEELRQENIRPELVMEQWEKSSEKLALFARHNEIKEVSHSITELCHSEERELLQFRVAEMYLRAIEHGEKITISNIF